MTTVAIIDYGMCNLDSVARAVEECGGRPAVTDDPRELKKATHVVLPGVGAFAEAMDNLRRTGFDVAIREIAYERATPLLGICLGMQLLATRGYEGKQTPGLDLVRGEVRKLQPLDRSERVPHIGWNEVNLAASCPLFDGVASGRDFYFVHSYHFVCEPGDVVATTPYAGGFTSVVGKDRIFGTQFHPEKSQRAGFALLRNFLKL